MKYTIEYTNRFKKSLRLCEKRGLDIDKLKTALQLLEETGVLPETYRPHKLSGDYSGCWECHIESDWLLVWKQDDTTFTLLIVDTGSHSDLFG